jgi:conjugal transfer pilus assembly protein TraF
MEMMMKTYNLLLTTFLLSIIVVLPTAAQTNQRASWCERQPELGWNFYCDDPEDEEISIEAPLSTPPAPPISAVERLDQLHEEVSEAKALAVLEPNEENVERYMRLQNEVMVQAGEFVDVWRRVVWQTPDLDYEGEHPQSHRGKEATKVALFDNQEATLEKLKDTHALIYVGSGHCAVCITYGPDLRRFAEHYGFTVLAVTADGSSLHGWESAAEDHGRLAALGIDVSRIPLTILYHRAQDQATVLGVGYIAENELRRRIYTLVELEVGDAF